MVKNGWRWSDVGSFVLGTQFKKHLIPSTKETLYHGQKWSEVVKNGRKWSKMVESGQRWLEMVENGRKWSEVVWGT